MNAIGIVARSVPSVRARLLAMLLIAAVPLFAMAAAISVQNHRIVADQTRQRVVRAREAVLARQGTFVGEAERLLLALSRVPELLTSPPEDCDKVLRDLLDVPGHRYDDIGVVDMTGHLRCAGRLDSTARPLRDAQMPDAALLRQVSQTGSFASGTIRASLENGQPILPLGGPLRRDGAIAGVVTAGLRVDWLAGVAEGDGAPRSATEAWAFDSSGLVALAGSAAGALPKDQDLARLPTEPDAVLATTSRDGRPFVYAEVTTPGEVRLLLAEPAAADLARAASVLGRRLAELGVLLIAGLGAVALGVDAAIVRPLRQVAEAVARWRAGGPFDEMSPADAPAEVTALANSFAEATAALNTREAQLRAATAQQELLMQEIHHRVKNNLQIIASLLNLQASRIRSPATRSEFQTARDRIRALATLHRHLYAHGELHTINMRSFLEELCQQLLQALGESPSGGRIALDIEAPELRLSSDQAVPMALIITEAVSNAVKYAFPGGRSGHVAVRLTHVPPADGDAGQETVRLTIDDNGVGIPAGRAETEAGVRDGIGLQLIRGFSRQLGAALDITEERGTRYSLLIPLRRERDDPAPAR